MSFPNIIYGDYGDEKVTSSAKFLPLGTLMVLPDGRKFRYYKASATATVPGKMYQQNDMAVVAGTADADILNALATSAGGVAGSTTITVTLAGTAALSKDLLADGYVFMVEGTGQALTYKIKSHPAAGSASTCIITLAEKDKFAVTIAAGTTKVGLRQNPYHNVTLTTADTVGVGALAGVPPVAATANYYGWIQRSGPVCCLTDATLIVGEPVTVSNAVAGAVEPIPPAAADTAGARVVKQMVSVGVCMNVAASTKYSLIDLSLE